MNLKIYIINSVNSQGLGGGGGSDLLLAIGEEFSHTIWCVRCVRDQRGQHSISYKHSTIIQPSHIDRQTVQVRKRDRQHKLRR